MKKHIYDEKNGLHYEVQGDYYIPRLIVDQPEDPIGIWGQRRHHYLREHRKAEYTALLLSGKLFPHLEEVNYQAQELYDRLINQMATQSGITEPIKAKDQMSWVQQMNTLAQQVREMIYEELIYT